MSEEFDIDAWAKQKIQEGENTAVVALIKGALKGEIKVCDAINGGVAIIKAEIKRNG